MIWDVGSDGSRRIDPSSGAVVASLPPGHGPTDFGGGAFWTLTTDPDRRCDPPVPADWTSYSPYRVARIDPVTNAIALGVDLPGTCRYAADNRDPEPELVVGRGTAWVQDPSTCRVFEIDPSRGDVSVVPQVAGRLVAADETGPWFLSSLDADRASSPPCVQPAPPLGLSRLDRTGALGRDLHVPGVDPPNQVDIANGVAWVTSPRAGGMALALARVDTNTGALLATSISPGSVAVGDDQVWFLGSFPENRRDARGANPGLLGEIAPDTGTVEREFHVDLEPAMWPVAKIVAVTEHAVWIDTGGAHRQVIQVAT